MEASSAAAAADRRVGFYSAGMEVAVALMEEEEEGNIYDDFGKGAVVGLMAEDNVGRVEAVAAADQAAWEENKRDENFSRRVAVAAAVAVHREEGAVPSSGLYKNWILGSAEASRMAVAAMVDTALSLPAAKARTEVMEFAVKACTDIVQCWRRFGSEVSSAVAMTEVAEHTVAAPEQSPCMDETAQESSSGRDFSAPAHTPWPSRRRTARSSKFFYS